ncbi:MULTISPECIES: hypothetical protein [unclassified Streptomyces]|uniref:hypothetical protein n=1 Tax=Streptomyces sp. NPDC127129 TaxID=3345373 RepID=UPI00362F69F4
MTAEPNHPLPFGKQVRSRVSGWTTRTLTAKPLRKTAPTVRFTALSLAAHSSPQLHGTLPGDLPEACRAVLPELLEKNFLAELSGDQYRLNARVRHLAGMLRHPADANPRRRKSPEFIPGKWAQWKASARLVCDGIPRLSKGALHARCLLIR